MVHDLILQRNRVGGWSLYDPDRASEGEAASLIAATSWRNSPDQLVDYAIYNLESPVRVVPEPVLFTE